MSDTTTREIDTDIGDPTDAAVTPGTGGGLFANVRALWNRLLTLGAAADASVGNTLWGLIGDPLDVAVAPGSEGSLHAIVRWIGTKILTAVGTTGDASTADTVLGLIGQPADAGVTTPTEGSLYARLAKILTWIGAGNDASVSLPNSGASLFGGLHATYDRADAAVTAVQALRPTGCGTYKLRLIIPTAVLATDDPGMNPVWVACPNTVTGTTYKNAQVWQLDALAADTGNNYIDSVDVYLHWRTNLSVGTSVASKWTIAPHADSNGGTMSTGHDITDEQTAYPKKGAVEMTKRLGQPPLTSVGGGSTWIRLCLALKGDASNTVCSAEVCDDSYIEVTYHARA
ncbi:MAG: hypothetical protein WCS88_04095 [Patescibacteria group bacterium]|jgi:hypothetical protein